MQLFYTRFRTWQAHLLMVALGLVLCTACGGSNTGSGSGQSGIDVPSSGPRLYRTGFSVLRHDVEEFVNVLEPDGTVNVRNYSINSEKKEITEESTIGNLPTTYRYDAAGRVIDHYRSVDGSYSTIITYNTDNTIQSVFYDYLPGRSIRRTFNYADAKLKSKTTEIFDINGGKSTSTLQYLYNNNGNLVGTEQINTETGLRFEFTIDDKGRASEILQYTNSTSGLQDPLGILTTRHVLEYDTHDNITHHHIYDTDGGLQTTHTFTYSRTSENIPNLTGFFAATNDGFLPIREVF